MVAERGWVTADELFRLTGEERPPSAGRWVVDPAVLAREREALRDRVFGAGPLGFDTVTLDEHERAVLDLLADDGEVEVAGGRAVAAGAADPLAAHPFVTALESQPFSPPSPAEVGVDPAELRELVKRGPRRRTGRPVVCTVGDRRGRQGGRRNARRPTRRAWPSPTFAQRLGTTRKWAVPLLTILDRRGITRRRGDVRVAGPRLPESS